MKHKLAILSFAIASAASAQNLAIVNGKAIPSSRVAAMESQITASGQPITEQVKKQIREELINREIFAQEAVARGLHTTADFQQQLELARSTVLIRALILDEQAKNPIGDEQAKAEYDRITAEMNQKEYQTAHILVADEAKAKKLIAELEAGAEFAKLAEEHSQDPGSGANGGELGWAGVDAFVPEFTQAMISLEKGATTKEPVKSQFGWHIIRLLDTRQSALPPFADVREQIVKSLRERQFAALQGKLREAARVE